MKEALPWKYFEDVLEQLGFRIWVGKDTYGDIIRCVLYQRSPVDDEFYQVSQGSAMNSGMAIVDAFKSFIEED